MQLGFVSAIFPDQTLEQVFEFATGHGFDCVELMCWPTGKAQRRYAGVTHVDVTSFDESDAHRVNDLASSHGVAISGLGYYPNVLSPDAHEAQAGIEHIRKVIRAARMLGVNTMTSFIGRDPSLTVDANWPRFLEVWSPLVAFAEEQGVRIAIENCPMFFTDDEWPGGKNLAVSPAIWRRMFDALPSDYFGLNYDPSHLIWQRMDYLAPLREFADRLFHIHAKDARLDQDRLDDVGMFANPSLFHTPKLPGLGEVDWKKFMSMLSEVGYDGPVCVEVEDRDYEDTLESRCEALRKSAGYLREFMS